MGSANPRKRRLKKQIKQMNEKFKDVGDDFLTGSSWLNDNLEQL